MGIKYSIACIQRLIAEIDSQINKQLAAIIESSRLERLEASWRGLFYLTQLSAKPFALVKLYDMSWNELIEQFDQAAYLEQTPVYKQVCQKELNTLGGNPFGLILCDHAIDSPDYGDSYRFYNETEMLKKLSSLGEQGLCPIIVDIAPNFFNCDVPAQLLTRKFIERSLNNAQYAHFHELRLQPSCRFLGLLFPGIYWQQSINNFSQYGYCPEKKIIKGKAVFAFAACVLQAFIETRWFTWLHCWGDEAFNEALIPEAEGTEPSGALLAIDENLEYEYTQLGFIPLSTSRIDKKLAIFSSPSAYQEKNIYSRLHAISRLLTVCRIAHYLKVLFRERIGSFESVSECQAWLQSWLDQYCSNVKYNDYSVITQFPLKYATANVYQPVIQPFSLLCDLIICPHSPYEEPQQEVRINIRLKG